MAQKSMIYKAKRGTELAPKGNSVEFRSNMELVPISSGSSDARISPGLLAKLGTLGQFRIVRYGNHLSGVVAIMSTKDMIARIHASQARVAAPAELSGIYALAGAIYHEIGSGHCESIYRNALAFALMQTGLGIVRCEVPVPVRFQGHNIGVGYADIVLFGAVHAVVFELKAVRGKISDAHRAQLRAYMRGLASPYGFVVNFPDEGAPETEFVTR